MKFCINIRKKLIPVFLTLIILFAFCCCDNNNDIQYFLNSYTQLNLYGGDVDLCKNEINEFLKDFEDKISVNIKTSEVSLFNSLPKNEEIELSQNVFDLFKRALQIYNDTNGAFNPCMYDLSLLWGFTPPNNENFGIIPSDSDIEKYKALATPENIILNEDNNTVYKNKDSIKIDLGGIAKGYAVGICREIATKHNIIGGTINIAGNIYCIGDYNNKGEKTKKIIAITNPRIKDNKQSFFANVLLNDTSISVSGDYERYFIKDDIRYCHILDVNTGRPVNNNIMSVIIENRDATLADAYATAVMVSGIENGINFLQDNNINGIILTEDKQTEKKYYYKIGDIELTNINENYEQIIL